LHYFVNEPFFSCIFSAYFIVYLIHANSNPSINLILQNLRHGKVKWSWIHCQHMYLTELHQNCVMEAQENCITATTIHIVTTNKERTLEALNLWAVIKSTELIQQWWKLYGNMCTQFWKTHWEHSQEIGQIPLDNETRTLIACINYSLFLFNYTTMNAH